MSDPNSNSADAPQELTPEARAVLGRAKRSFAISIGVLLAGFIAIGGALVYRSMRDVPEPAAIVYATDALRLPEGAEVISAIASAGTITVTYRLGPATQVRLFGEDGAMLRQFDIGFEN